MGIRVKEMKSRAVTYTMTKGQKYNFISLSVNINDTVVQRFINRIDNDHHYTIPEYYPTIKEGVKKFGRSLIFVDAIRNTDTEARKFADFIASGFPDYTFKYFSICRIEGFKYPQHVFIVK